MGVVAVRVDKNGAFIIPMEMPEALGIPTGGKPSLLSRMANYVEARG
jgi:bifunctional DNA-binding transcriptional regulator/antitoxin component of YhaV-PrlF toxin-antitoxin module